jgi:hypothetical protein
MAGDSGVGEGMPPPCPCPAPSMPHALPLLCLDTPCCPALPPVARSACFSLSVYYPEPAPGYRGNSVRLSGQVFRRFLPGCVQGATRAHLDVPRLRPGRDQGAPRCPPAASRAHLDVPRLRPGSKNPLPYPVGVSGSCFRVYRFFPWECSGGFPLYYSKNPLKWKT